MQPILKMINITKTFPGVVANRNVNLEVYHGEIHALLGENGAGKSTLMNVLYGLYQADSGEIYFEGKRVNFESAKDAIRAGIGMIHQHFMLIPVHTVLDNIIMGLPGDRGIFYDRALHRERVLEIAHRYGLEIDPDAYVQDLSVGAQQRVEIVKALYRKAKLLIMDEPTAVLTPQEVKELFSTLKKLSQEGMSIILITHKLNEVLEVADRVTVLRDGQVIKTLNTKDADEKLLAQLMVGREVNFVPAKSPCQPGPVVLEIKDLVVKNQRGITALNGLSLTVRGGEILGIAGVDGNGQTELAEAIAGLIKPVAGTILLNGEPIVGKKPRVITEKGLGHIPEDRHKRGLVLDFTLSENIILQSYYCEPWCGKFGFLNLNSIKSMAQELLEKYKVKAPHSEVAARTLSGGNQQKVVVAREISRRPKLLLAVQPTRGVDVGAIEYIHEQIIKERERGAAVLLISTELSEILALSDRIAVIYKGQIMGEMTNDNPDINEIGLMMAGIRKKKEAS
ncbi:nucleoside ABC transporter ATP-binding protein [Carboxydothermus islandicus]|uniref:Nucleoside ABC transporter ATP-binding protein n=1 Tax=Carboxydothermus islandicus TaxID=661089 RepID=A0A1L8CZ77_9THEO|nr:ABC transporter ATP-binding protein [Carboxydothermus islandicus]GAV24246.1 nucleoside ABC transporter ATP-binding protein [Carboxydothermus islandicus]